MNKPDYLKPELQNKIFRRRGRPQKKIYHLIETIVIVISMYVDL